MLSGKDTLADALTPALTGGVHRFTFSDLIRAEANPALDIIRRHSMSERSLMEADVADALGLRANQSRAMVAVVAQDALADPLFTFSRRTEGTRTVLQHLGSDWRPEGYWANKVFRHAKEKERDHDAVIMVGSRYPVEHDLFTHGGAYTIRLDVSRSEQKMRALKRDGVIPTDKQFSHPSETLLDDALFGLRIDTDDRSARGVGERTLAWLKGRPSR